MHWHTIAGLRGGYLPNTNEVFATKREALAEAQFHLDQYRDVGDKVKGSARAMFWIARESESLPGTYWDYVEVVKCDDDCESDAEDY